MGLVQYESSDEDEDAQVEAPAQPSSSATQNPVSQPQTSPAPPPAKPTSAAPSTAAIPDAPPSQPQQQQQQQQQPPQPLGPLLGPALGPAPPPANPALAMDLDQPASDDLSFLSHPPSHPPRSPYTSARALLRDLTLPAVPNMDIPPSPPGSPRPPGLDALNAKFDAFLRLKRAGDAPQHFNARLAASAALRNPALTDKLLGFAGLGEGGGADEYGTTLAKEVWDPRGFPEWAFKGALRRAREEGRRGPGEKVEFVSAGVGGGAEAGAAPVRGGRRTMFDT